MTKLRKCNNCKRKKLVSEFGRNKARPDGINLYCKVCRAEDMTKRRAALKTFPVRKEMIVAKKVATVTERVFVAVARGYRTRESIQMFTKLDEDRVCDALARLAFDESAIRIVR